MSTDTLNWSKGIAESKLRSMIPSKANVTETLDALIIKTIEDKSKNNGNISLRILSMFLPMDIKTLISLVYEVPITNVLSNRCSHLVHEGYLESLGKEGPYCLKSSYRSK